MQIKNQQYTFGGANQDINKSKHPFKFYYEAQHIRITATEAQSTASIANEKGNELVISIPNIVVNSDENKIEYNDEELVYSNTINNKDTDLSSYSNMTIENNEIIGHATTRDGVILFVSNDEYDSIWYLEDVLSNTYNLKLLYLRKLNFSKNNPIQALFNYENENIQKVYWVDGNNQPRFINITHNNIEGNNNLIDIPKKSLDFVGEIEFDQPYVSDISSGGTHTSGMIQYAYNLYRLNGSQSKISPLSELIPIDKGNNLGGGEVGEVIGSSPVVKIDNLDRDYDYIKLYAIKYTSYNQIPSIGLIDEREINTDTVTILDDGSTIDTLTLEEFLFLGSDPIVPKHIEIKDNRLFPTNIEESNFLLPDELDCRCYSFNNSGKSKILNNVTDYNPNLGATSTGIGSEITLENDYNVPKEFSAINKDYNKFKYNKAGLLGGEGKYFQYRLNQVDENTIKNYYNNRKTSEDLKFFKDNEIYRIGIVFYNKLGQESLPQWMADFRAPEGNLEGNYNILNVYAKSEFNQFLNNYEWDSENDKPIGYKIVRANRTENDKTILEQGVLSNMVLQNKNGDQVQNETSETLEIVEDTSLKVPSWLIRHNENYPDVSNAGPFGGVLQRNKHLGLVTPEVFNGKSENDKYQLSGIHDKMLQLYSPELLFNNVNNFSNGLYVRTKGMVEITKANSWIQERNISTKKEKNGGKMKGGINSIRVDEYVDATITENNNILAAQRTPYDDSFFGSGNISTYGIYGFINPSGSEETMNFRQYYREYEDYVKASNNYNYKIYGKPEFTIRGQESKFYNKDPKYEYTNSLQSIISDKPGDTGDDVPAITNVNSYNSQCLTIVLGNDNDETRDRKGLQNLFYNAGFGNEKALLITEIKKPDIFIYAGNIYGGNSYADKKRTNYIKIGDYKNITYNNNNVNIEPFTCLNPGDTFVQNFELMRVGKTDIEVYSNDSIQITDIIKYPTETTIDLKNRNDISFNNWDARFQPRESEYHKYNKVYSQQPTLIKSKDVDFKFKRIEQFDTRIQSTKLKIPNESIDSWTDILENETLDLNGKYGPINNIISFKDNLYTFQDKAIAALQINPRIQVQASDGVGIELGTGNVLYDYKYLTDKTGSINKWGIISGKKGIYYYDALNKSIGRVPKNTDYSLSDAKGMHTFFNEYYNYNDIKKDNPLINKGVLFGYDNYNNDVYFTILQDKVKDNIGFNFSESESTTPESHSFTWRFNELIDQFIDLKTYHPRHYITNSDKFLISNNNKDLYEQYVGEYNKFFGEYQDSYITLMVNPHSQYDKVFNNIQYNSEVYLNDLDQPEKTLTHIEAWNEYQNSGKIPLKVGRSKNLRRKFRNWQANIPRDGRNRIRNPWIFLKLYFTNENNYKLILHDIIVKYSI